MPQRGNLSFYELTYYEVRTVPSLSGQEVLQLLKN